MNTTMNQLDLFHTYGIFYPTTVKYTLLSRSDGTLAKIDKILPIKTPWKIK